MQKIVLISLGVFIASLILQYIILYLSRRYHLFIDSPSDDKPQGFHGDDTPRSATYTPAVQYPLL